MKLIYLDTETTGLHPQMHEIVQLSGMIEIEGEIKDTFDFRLQPTNFSAISQKALDCNGLTIKEMKTFPLAKDVFYKFVSLLNKHVNINSWKDRLTIVGQNAPFDRDMLKGLFGRMGYPDLFTKYFDLRTLDLCVINLLLMKLGILNSSSVSMDSISDIYGVKIAKMHDAWYDINGTREIISLILKAFIKDIDQIDLSDLVPDSPLYHHIKNLKKGVSHRKEET